MKQFSATAMAGAFFFIGACPAFAYKIGPAGSFTGFGGMVFQNNRGYMTSCTVDIAGTNPARGASKLTAFTPQRRRAQCPGATPSGLPWGFRATSYDTAVITNFSFGSPRLGACGPANLTVNVLANGQILFNNLSAGPSCVVTGVMNTTPAISIRR